MHPDMLFAKIYIIVSRWVKNAIMPKYKYEGAVMSLRVVSGTCSPKWLSYNPDNGSESIPQNR